MMELNLRSKPAAAAAASNVPPVGYRKVDVACLHGALRRSVYRILLVVHLVMALVMSGCGRQSAAGSAGMSPVQADDLFAGLRMEDVAGRCGGGDPSGSSKRHNVLKYSFGSFVFSPGDLILTDALIQVPGEPRPLVWTNVHGYPPDPDEGVRETESEEVRASEAAALLDGVSVYQHEGEAALKIIEDVPCLGTFSTRF